MMLTRKREIHELRKLAAKNAQMGKGQYIFENNTKGDLLLPRSIKISGVTTSRLPVGGQFTGDSYFFQLVPKELKFIEEIKEQSMEQKLITEQPPTFTKQGQVEHILEDKAKKLNEIKEDKKPEDPVLLTEHPLDGVKILFE